MVPKAYRLDADPANSAPAATGNVEIRPLHQPGGLPDISRHVRAPAISSHERLHQTQGEQQVQRSDELVAAAAEAADRVAEGCYGSAANS
jgi:hypothetical protein